MANEPAFDPAALEARFMGIAELYAEARAIFLRTAAQSLRDVESALGQGDAVALRAHVHKLKGSAAMIGAPRLAALCLSMEEDGASDPAQWLAAARAALAAFEAESGGTGGVSP